MKIQCAALIALAAAGLTFASAQAQPTAPGAAAPAKEHLIKLTNSGRGGITAIYVSRSGSTDVSDDLLGKQTAGPGKTVTLKVKDPGGDCVFDIEFLMNDGSMATKKAVNLCQTGEVSFGP
jgi:hypothetical protein